MPRTAQWSFASGELAPALHSRVDVSRFQSGLSTLRNFLVKPYGGAANRPGSALVCETLGSGATRLIGFSFSTVQTYILQFAHLTMRVVSGGGQVLYASGPSTGAPVTIDTPYTAAELRELYVTQSADVMTIVHPAHPVQELKRLAHDSWTLTAATFAPSLDAPVNGDWTLAKHGSGSGQTYSYQVSFENERGEESLPSPEKDVVHVTALDSTNWFEFNITLPAGAVRANVYKYKGGTFGWLGSTDDGYFEDKGLNPDVGQTPQTGRDPFGDPGTYPAAITYHEQRLTGSGSDNAPDTVEMSQSAAFKNFGKSQPAQDSDSITFTLGSDQVNRVWGLVSLRSLLLFTSGAVWRLDRGQKGLTPTLEGGVSRQMRVNCDRIPPLVAGSAALFSADGGITVRDLVYDVATDAYQGESLSLLSQHLMIGHGIVEWAYQASPWPIVWCVRSDGALLSLTYLREQQVTGWARHDTRGFYESVAVVTEGGQDAVYVVVRRRIGGAWKRFVERFASRIVSDVRDAFFVDCGLSLDLPVTVTAVALGPPVVVTAPGHGCAVGDLVDIDDVDGDPIEEEGEAEPDLASYLNRKRFRVLSVVGTALGLGDRYTGEAVDGSAWPAWLSGGVVRRATSTLTGLGHLAGREVAILADGNVLPRQVMPANGTLALDRAASRVHVGLPYASDLGTLPIASDPENFGRLKNLSRIQVYLDASRGLWAGPALDDLEDQEARLSTLRQRRKERWGEATRPVSGMIEIPVSRTWQSSGKALLRQVDPLPVEILSVLPVFDIGGKAS